MAEELLEPSPLRTHLGRYLPLALLTTLVVTVLPVIVVSLLVRAASPLLVLAAAMLASGLSLALATGGAALWKRWRGSRDLVFSDLLLWGWWRRYRCERMLGQARILYDSARDSGPAVSIQLVERLSRLLEARDASTHGHSQRVARHAGRIAEAMHRPPAEIAKIRTAAAVHDVGKLYTPRAILNKPGALTDAEYEVLKRHPDDGAKMLSRVGDRDIAAMVRHHHERLDGSGYPLRLVGEEIPLGARIIAVADTFDAISSDRVYRSRRTHKKALDILSREAGTKLDAPVVAAFMQSYSSSRRLAGLTFLWAFGERLLGWVQISSSGLGLGVAGVAPLLPALGAAGALALRHDHHAIPRARPAAAAISAVSAADQQGRSTGHRSVSLTPTRAGGPSGAGRRDHRRSRGLVERRATELGPGYLPTSGATAASLPESRDAAGERVSGTPVRVTKVPPTTTVPGVPTANGSVETPTPAPVSATGPPVVSASPHEVAVTTPLDNVTVRTPSVEAPQVEVPKVEVPNVEVPKLAAP